MITAEELRKLLHYDPGTGVFIWSVATNSNARIGDVAGSTNDRGYRLIRIYRRHYRAHRLAWLYMTGEWPAAEIDHINLDRADNRWNNLREASRSENQGNRSAQANNTSGFKGVCWDKQHKKWKAQISICRKRFHIGLFPTPEAAHAAYADAAAEYFGQFSRVA